MLYSFVADPDGDVVYVLELFWNSQPNSKDDFWSKWILIALGLCANQAAGIFLVFGSRPFTFPDLLWSVHYCWYVHGRDDERTIQQAESVFHHEFPCCHDEELTEKVFSSAAGPQGLLTGPPSESCYAAATKDPSCRTNDDLERDQAYNQRVDQTRSGNCISLGRINRSLPLRTFKLEHLKRSGVINHQLSRDRLDESGLKLNRSKAVKKPRTEKGQYAKRPSGYVLFLAFKGDEMRNQRMVQMAQDVADGTFDISRYGKRQVRSAEYKYKLWVKAKKADGLLPHDMQAIRAEWRSSATTRALWDLKSAEWTPPAPRPKAKAKGAFSKLLAFWEAGDERGPCSVQTLAEGLDAFKVPWEAGIFAQGTVHTHGAVTCGRKIIEDDEEEIIVIPEQRPGKRLKKLDHKKTCWQLHPGLCIGRHCDEVAVVKRTTCNLNTVFSAVNKHTAIASFVRFTLRAKFVTSLDGHRVVMFLMVSRVRHARPKVQVFVGMQPLTFDDDGVPTSASIHMRGRKQFNIVTSYQAMRSLLKRGLMLHDREEDIAITKVTIQEVSGRIRRSVGEDHSLTVTFGKVEANTARIAKGEEVALFPGLLEREGRKTKEWREAAQNSDGALKSLATVKSQAERLKALDKWGKKAFAKLWGSMGGGLAYMQDADGFMAGLAAGGKGKGAGRGPGDAKGKAGKGRGKGKKGKKGAADAAAAMAAGDSSDDADDEEWEAKEFAAVHGGKDFGPLRGYQLGGIFGRMTTDKYPFGVGLLIWNHTSESIDAHCLLCSLAINKTVRKRAGARGPVTRAQGRPMGAHLVLLRDCPGSEWAHRQRWCAEFMTFTKRHSERLAHQGPHLQPLFDREREEFAEDVNGEPPALP